MIIYCYKQTSCIVDSITSLGSVLKSSTSDQHKAHPEEYQVMSNEDEDI